MATMTNLGFGNDKTKNAMRGANREDFTVIVNGRAVRPPIRTLYVFSVAKRPFSVRHTLAGNLTLAGCENGERYVRCCSFPDPIPQACPDHERGGTRVDENDALISVIDMLNPGNFTLDPYTGSKNPDFYSNRNGTNYISEGIFPSWNEEPAEEEIKRAEECRNKRYRYLTKEALRLAAVSTKQLNEFLQQYPDTHVAMDILGIKANWHSTNEVQVSCPNCGMDIKQGIAYHMMTPERLCVIDWRRAVEGGVVKKEQVPGKFRWKGFADETKSE